MNQAEQVTLGAPKAGGGYNEAFVTDSYDPHTGNLSDQLLTRSTTTPADVDDTKYGYTPAGMITSETDQQLGSPASTETQCYTYTTQQQLSKAWTATDNCAATPTTSSYATVGDPLGTSSEYFETWAYNNLGQRTTQTALDPTTSTFATTTYGYSTTQPTALTSATTTGATTAASAYGYNADGQQTTRTTPATSQTLTWNNASQLTTVTDTATSTTDAAYVYTPDGTLLSQTNGTSTTLYLPGEQLTDNNGTISGIRYYALPGGATAVRTGPGNDYYFEIPADQHGTNTLYLDYTAQNPTRRQYDPYGNPRGTPLTWIDNRAFLGDITDPATTLTNIGARWYDPTTGTFTSPDPLLQPSSPLQLNGYTYSAGDPVTASDPTGQLEEGPPGTGCSTGNESASQCSGNGNSGTSQNDDTQDPQYNPNQGNANGLGGGTNNNPDPGQNLLPETDRAAYLEWISTWQDNNQYATGAILEIDSIAAFCNIQTCSSRLYNWATYSRLRLVALTGGPGFGLAGTMAGEGGLGEARIPSGNAPAGSGEPDLAARAQTAAEDDLAQLGCGQSFTPQTQVLLADGKTKPISQLQPGDKVLATNTHTGKTQTETVSAVLIHHDTNLYNLTIKTPHTTTTIHTTTNHAFWDPYLHHWIPAVKLRPGEHLLTAKGTIAIADGGTTPKVHEGWMWDLTIPGNNDHDFYVIVGYTPVLVHNASCPTGFDYEAASQSGMRADRNGLTRAGREYQKHMGRGELPTVGGRGLDSAGQDLLDGILTDPSADYQPVTGGAFSGGYRVIGNDIVNGRFVGATFDSSGNFQYFGMYP